MSKALKFFKKASQFQKPPKVLLSGSFISFMCLSKKTHHHIAKLLSMNVNLFVTSCAIRNVDFGSEIPDQALKSLKINIVSCGHRGRCDEIDCLLAAVQGGNEDGYFVATATKDYVNLLQQAEMVPVIHLNGSQIVLMKPSECQEELADGSGRDHRGRHLGRFGGIGRDHRGGGRAV